MKFFCLLPTTKKKIPTIAIFFTANIAALLLFICSLAQFDKSPNKNFISLQILWNFFISLRKKAKHTEKLWEIQAQKK